MAASFLPNPVFKLVFEIHHFYVEGKANNRKDFLTRLADGGRGAQKRPQARERRALGVGEVGRKPGEKAVTSFWTYSTRDARRLIP